MYKIVLKLWSSFGVDLPRFHKNLFCNYYEIPLENTWEFALTWVYIKKPMGSF